VNAEQVRVRRSGFTRVVFGSLFVALLLLVVVVVLGTMRPPIFTPPSLDDVEAAELARAFEKNFAAEFTRIRDDEEPWGVRVREDDLNAWLWFRFPAWVAHARGEKALGSTPFLQVTFEKERMRFSTDSVVLALAPTVRDGRAVVEPTAGNSAGRLPLPVLAVQWGLRSIELGELGQVVAGSEPTGAGSGDPIPLPRSVTLPDGRVVDLLEIQLEDGEAILVFRTQAP
jgi:hypothetical protein